PAPGVLLRVLPQLGVFGLVEERQIPFGQVGHAHVEGAVRARDRLEPAGDGQTRAAGAGAGDDDEQVRHPPGVFPESADRRHDLAADAGGVQAEHNVKLLRSAVVADHGPRHADGVQADGTVAERLGDRPRQRSGVERLDHDHVVAGQLAVQALGVEGGEGGGVEHGHVHAGGDVERAVEHGADGDHGGLRTASLDQQPAELHVARLAVDDQLGAEVGEVAVGVGGPHQAVGLSGSAGYQDLGCRYGQQRLDVAGGVVGGAFGAIVIGAADGDHQHAQLLVAEVELELLERAFGDEGGDRVDDGVEALEGVAGGDADHRLLHDADVHGAGGVVGEDRLE